MDNIQGMMTLHVECQARRACVGGARVTTNTYIAACKWLRHLVRCHLLRGGKSTKGGPEGDGPQDERSEQQNRPRRVETRAFFSFLSNNARLIRPRALGRCGSTRPPRSVRTREPTLVSHTGRFGYMSTCVCMRCHKRRRVANVNEQEEHTRDRRVVKQAAYMYVLNRTSMASLRPRQPYKSWKPPW
jgi:hypothetical protein